MAYQFIGSLSLASLFSLLTWPILQMLCFYKIIHYAKNNNHNNNQNNISTVVKTTSRWEQKLWNFEWQIHHLDCNIFALIIIESQSFSKSWKQLNSGLVKIQLLNNIIELIRCLFRNGNIFWINILFCETANFNCFSYYSNYIIWVCYFISSAILTILQHIMSTVIVCYCLQEYKATEEEIFGNELNFIFRHESFKCHLVKLLKTEETKLHALKNGCISNRLHNQSSGSYIDYRNLNIQWIENPDGDFSVKGFSLHPPIPQPRGQKR
uniref:Uncharacterized protein n=1 Tax=Trichobilharzia regenti TaxID=157069 RepID=A0AA85ISI5_TRIRE|nr:unnamed protein product [Trichobilharzia regenti]